jgi:phosphoribosylformylglycinamidine synthase
MKRVRVLILRAAGTNCDMETAFAFQLAGADTELVHVNELTSKRKKLDGFQILAIPGGFTYGDDIASGKILANELKFELEDGMRRFVKDGNLIIGICNGFQILVKAGLLPNLAGDLKTIDTTLTLNDSARFEDRWVYLKKFQIPNSKFQRNSKFQIPNSKTACVWTEGIDDVIYLPVAHAEGKFIPKDDAVLRRLKKEGMIVFKYVDEKGKRAEYPANPNGSVEGIAGICDPSGRIFGLMPHPERHISYLQHPCWTRKRGGEEGDGLKIFKNGVRFAKMHL